MLQGKAYDVVSTAARCAHAATTELEKHFSLSAHIVDWDELAEIERKRHATICINLLAAMSRGQEPSPVQAHALMVRYLTAAGWRYGPQLNARTREHPQIVTFDRLTPAQQQQYYVLVAIVKAFAQYAAERV